MHHLRLQGAMEYMMTYGWAILIIVIVLVGIVSLGIFNGSNDAPQACTTESGYACSQVIYSHATGTVTFSFSQSTGRTWTTANVYFISYANGSSVAGVPSQIINYPASGNTIGASTGSPLGSGLVSGQITPVTLTVSGPNVTVGNPAGGKLWVAYQSKPGGTVYYENVATMLLKAS